jgi:hypothetical protein
VSLALTAVHMFPAHSSAACQKRWWWCFALGVAGAIVDAQNNECVSVLACSVDSGLVYMVRIILHALLSPKYNKGDSGCKGAVPPFRIFAS